MSAYTELQQKSTVQRVSMTLDDEWTVVGASGKARPSRTSRQQPAAGCVHAAQQPTSAVLSPQSTCSTHTALPGWSQHEYHAPYSPASRSRKSRRHKQQAGRTLEEQVEALGRLVAQCREEVAHSQFYKHLKLAFESTASHQLPHGVPAPRRATDACLHIGAATASQQQVAPEALLQDDAIARLQGITLYQPASPQAAARSTEDPSDVLLPLQGSSTPHNMPHRLPQPPAEQRAAGISTGPAGVGLQAQACEKQACLAGVGLQAQASEQQARDDQQQQGQSKLSTWATAVKQLVCYGLGSIQDSRNARYQLGLLLLLQHELLPGLTCPPEVYDPQFNEVDIMLLKQLNLHVLTHNEQCARRVSRPTFFFLPHVEGHMCDNLLAANLAQAGTQRGCTLNMTVLLANSFSTYHDRWEVGQMRPAAAAAAAHKSNHDTTLDDRPRRPDTMLKLIAAGLVKEVSVPQESSFPAPSAFNDTSLHLFSCPMDYH